MTNRRLRLTTQSVALLTEDVEWSNTAVSFNFPYLLDKNWKVIWEGCGFYKQTTNTFYDTYYFKGHLQIGMSCRFSLS